MAHGSKPGNIHNIESLQNQLIKLGENDPLLREEIPQAILGAQEAEYGYKILTPQEQLKDQYEEARRLAIETKQWVTKRKHEIRISKLPSEPNFDEVKDDEEPKIPQPQNKKNRSSQGHER